MLVFGVDIPLVELMLTFLIIIFLILVEVIIVLALQLKHLKKMKELSNSANKPEQM